MPRPRDQQLRGGQNLQRQISQGRRLGEGSIAATVWYQKNCPQRNKDVESKFALEVIFQFFPNYLKHVRYILDLWRILSKLEADLNIIGLRNVQGQDSYLIWQLYFF